MNAQENRGRSECRVQAAPMARRRRSSSAISAVTSRDQPQAVLKATMRFIRPLRISVLSVLPISVLCSVIPEFEAQKALAWSTGAGLTGTSALAANRLRPTCCKSEGAADVPAPDDLSGLDVQHRRGRFERCRLLGANRKFSARSEHFRF